MISPGELGRPGAANITQRRAMTLFEFDQRFPTEKESIDYLQLVRIVTLLFVGN